MQVDPIKPTLKAPVSKRLKLYYNEPPSIFAFEFNLRRYTEVANLSREVLQLENKFTLDVPAATAAAAASASAAAAAASASAAAQGDDSGKPSAAAGGEAGTKSSTGEGAAAAAAAATAAADAAADAEAAGVVGLPYDYAAKSEGGGRAHEDTAGEEEEGRKAGGEIVTLLASWISDQSSMLGLVFGGLMRIWPWWAGAG